MKFVKLDHQVLLSLKEQGYNVLRSNSPMTEENPTWIPDTFDLDSFFDLDSDEVAKRNIPLQETWLLLIDQGLKERDEDLFGDVLLEGPA